MNVTGGGLSFDISGTNDKLLKVLAESKKAIQTFSTTAQQGGKGIDAAFESTKAAIDRAFAQIGTAVDTNKAAIAQLEQKYKELSAAINAAFQRGDIGESTQLAERRKAIEAEISTRKGLIEEAGKQADALLAEVQAMNRQKEAAEKNGQAQQSLRSQLLQVREQLALMEANGERGTEAFKRLQQEAGRLTNAIADATTQARIFSHDNRGLQGMISGLSGVAGAFTAAQGATALFIGENENLQKAMLKVQSLMSITMGLQQVMNTLNKDSAFMLTTVAKAKEMLAVANTKLAAALGISTVAAQALMAALTLGLSVAITAVVAAISKMNSAADAAKKKQLELANAVAQQAAKPIAKIEELSLKWQELGDNMDAKKRFIEENQAAFEELGVSVGNVTQAENILINKKAAFIQAQLQKAKACAYAAVAADKYKEYLEKIAERDQESSNGNVYLRWRNGWFSWVNLYKEKNDEATGLLNEFNELTRMASESLTDSYQTMTDAEIQAASNYETGTVGALEHLISVKQAMLKKISDPAEYQQKQREIEQLQAQKNRITGEGGKSGGGGSGKKEKTEAELYADELKAMKQLYSQYAKWVQSEDATVRAAAASEFEGVLAQGTSYLDYLERQRTIIEEKAVKTAADLQKLHAINNEIAETTKATVLNDFNTQLQADLAQCRTISEMLDLIEQRRGELSGDNSELDNAKAESLNTAETDVKEQAKQETAALLEEYAAYLQEKIDFEESYARKRELLTRRAAEASTDAERQVAEAALEALEAKREEYSKRSGSEMYDQMLTEYQTAQQQQTAILEKYAKQRVEAEKQGNLVMVGLINAKQQEEISKLAAQRLMASESWNQLFGDISRLSTTTINRLLNDIQSRKINLSAQFNPADLKAINDQLEKARTELEKRNPFLALKQSLSELRAAMRDQKLLDSDDPFVKSLEAKKKAYQEYMDALNSDDATVAGGANQIYADLLKGGTSYIEWLKAQIAALNQQKVELTITVEGEQQLAILNAALNKETGVTKKVSEGFKDAFSSIGGSLDFVKGCFDSVVSGIEKMGIQMDEETKAILGDISSMMESASQLAGGIATGNPLSIITGSIGLLSSAFDLFNFRDRKAEKSIKKHEENLTRLERTYTALQHAVDNALGETVYQNQSAQIKNLRAQQNEIRGMINDEYSKKHTDYSKIEEYQERIAEAERTIEDIIKEITESITQTSAGELADELADALVEAWNDGKTAAEAFGDVANQVLQNAVKNALKLQFLEKPLQKAIEQLQRDMGFDAEGNGSFDGLTDEEQARFKAAIQAAGANFAAAMEMYEDLFKELDDSDPTTLSGAIKGASQESIDLLAGQTNAVRQNQVTSLSILREQLGRLANIDGGISKLYEKVNAIYNRISGESGTDLRSQGLTD